MDLAFYDHRVDLRATVIAGHIAFDHDMPVVFIDFHDRHVGAEGVNKVGRVVERRGLQSRFHALGQVPGHVSHSGHLLDRLHLIRRALDGELAVLVFHIRFGRFQQVSSQKPGLLFDLAGRQHHCSRAHCGGPAAVGAPAHRCVAGVAVDDGHVVYIDAQFVGDNLGEGGLLSLSVGRSSGVNVHLAGGMEAHYGALPQTAAEADGAGHL